jgi:hypothetical protein
MYILQLVVSLFLVVGLCDGLDFKTTECEERCKTKVRIYRMYICDSLHLTDDHIGSF